MYVQCDCNHMYTLLLSKYTINIPIVYKAHVYYYS